MHDRIFCKNPAVLYCGLLMFFVSSCVLQQPTFEWLDLTKPGYSQEELDEYTTGRDLASPNVNIVIKPEQMKAYHVARNWLDDLREEKPYFGDSNAYMIGIGENEDAFIIAFMERITRNDPDIVRENLEKGHSDWRSYYGTGDAPGIAVNVSKADFSVLSAREIIQ